MGEVPQIRIGDDDRERYNATVKRAYVEGRITDAELEDRLTRVLDARYESDLTPVVADLPNTPDTRGVPTSNELDRGDDGDGDGDGDGDDGGGISYSPFLIAPIITTAIYAMTDFGGYFWPMWVWFGCGIPILVQFLVDDDDE